MRRIKNPVESLSKALGHASYSEVFSDAYYRDHQLNLKTRKPLYEEIIVEAMFVQKWGSTSLGFEGVGGAAMTEAYTVVLTMQAEYAVYFGGRFAYVLKNPNDQFFTDLKNQCLAPVADHQIYCD